jgi:hypothetical protein
LLAVLAVWLGPAGLRAQTSDKKDEKPAAAASGGEQLSSREVSGLPLNKRDFSQLLLLAAGTMTDANGAANYTQQFAINGQRGTATVFAMDGIETTDPEMGGATFSNFNVDAVDEIRSYTGVMPAEIGHGAAGFTDIVTKTGTNQLHGSAFEFLRNAALDARNFFDRRSDLDTRRIPSFARNEFGLANGGPVMLPGLYNGRDRTFYFVQYQGFRQVLGTTQVIPVPTAAERRGLDTTAFAGDTLYVPVSPAISPLLARYPMPNDPQGPYGARTFATSSKVSTVSDQFSVRLDHRISSKANLFFRFSLNDVDGPLTNPSQTAIDRSFAAEFLDRQRNAGLKYSRNLSPRLTMETALGFLRSTPSFPAPNHVQPALKFADGLYEAFNAPGGTVTAVRGNLFQLRQSFAWTRGKHAVKFGFETRLNRDSTFFAMSPNGEYTFGGGAAYSPVYIRSATGAHDVHPGDPLPDGLSGLLTATPFSYAISVPLPLFGQGDHVGDAAIRREAYSFYIQDAWKASPRLMLSYGLRYEVNSRFREAAGKTSGLAAAPQGQKFLVNLQPPYGLDWKGFGPRLALDLRLDDRTTFHAGGALVTNLPNLFQDNFITGGAPQVFRVFAAASPGAPLPFANAVTGFPIPTVYTTNGRPVYSTGHSKDVPANTEMDVDRFLRDLAAVTPGHQIRPFTPYAMSADFRNGYIGTWTAGLERSFGDFKLSASYVATAGVSLPVLSYPNGYAGAEPAFAPYTKFDSSGRVTGGFGPEFVLTSGSHSTFHSLQSSLAKNSLRRGLGFQLSYTFSKSLDDTSAAMGGFLSSASGTVMQTSPQNPGNTRAEKGPSTFDVTHVLAISVLQELRAEQAPLLRRLPRVLTGGWQALNITTLMSGSPFTVYSGIQQTGVGSGGADRPDQVGVPDLSTSRAVREDYFGQGAGNARFFSIPVGIVGGTGPNRGRFGGLGRNTFRGPGLHNFDCAIIKDTPLTGPGRGREPAVLEFRAEFFNVFNLVNFGLPANIALGPGFGVINRTAGTSRQIQFSLKLLY